MKVQRLLRKILGLFIMLQSVGIMALESPVLTLPLMKKAPSIDGNISEDEWKYAAKMQGSCWNKTGQIGTLYPAEMFFWVGADRKYFYIAVKRAVGPAKLMNRVLPNPDINPNTFSDDSVETVIVPDLNAEKIKIIHSNINNRGAVYKMAKTKTETLPFSGKWKTKGTVKDGWWNFEMAIPWKDLGVNGVPRKTGVRICMNWKRVQEWVQTAWEPEKTQFFGQTALPTIFWKNDAPVVQVHSVREYNGSVVKDGKITIFNPSGKDLSVRVNYHFFPVSSHDFKLNRVYTIPAGKTEVIMLGGGPLHRNESLTWKLHVTSVDGKEKYYVREYYSRPAESANVFLLKKDNDNRISFSFAYYPSYRKMLFRANVGTVTDKSQLKGLKAVVRYNQKTIAEIPFGKSMKNGECLSSYDSPDFGEYIQKGDTSAVFHVDFYSNGKKVATQQFEHHIFPWTGNRIGKSDIIVPPFTGVKWENNTVKVLLREHLLNSIGLPQQIVAKDGKILKDNGFVLEASIDGTRYEAKGSLKVSKKGNSFLNTESGWNAGALEGSSSVKWDQDGMAEWILSLKKGAVVDSLKLKITLDNSLVDLMHTCGDGARINYAGSVPGGSGKIWDSSKVVRIGMRDYVPYIWLGSDEQGISVFGENDKNWVTAKGVPEFEMFRDGDKLILVLNLIAKKTKLTSDRTIRLGFMATPVKPMPKDFRRWNAWAHFSNGVNREMVKQGYFKYSTNLLGSGWYFGAITTCSDVYPADFGFLRKMAEARNTQVRPDSYILNYWKKYSPNDARSKARRTHYLNGFNRAMSLGNENIFYYNARGARFKGTPEGRFYLNEWYKGAVADREVMDIVSYDLDPAESYRDYAVWWYKKTFETGAMDQLYWDDIFLSSNFNLVGTDAYLRDDGSIQPASGLFNMRELVRRSAYMVAEMKRENRSMIHMTSTNIMPIISYGRQHFDWEENLGFIDFQDRHTRDYIRAMSHGRQSGNFPVMLVAITANPKKDLSPEKYRHWIRTAAGVMLTHELRWHKNFDEFWAALKLLFDCGYATDDSKVYNYWQKDYPVRITGGETSSLFSIRKNDAVLMVCDWSKGGTFTAVINKKTLGFAENMKAVDAETGKELPVQGNKINFSLKKHDFIIIKLIKR